MSESKGGWLRVVLVIAGACVVIGACQNLFGGNDDSDYIYSAHSYVQDQLKSPSTASWCDNDEVTTNDNGDHIVIGCVDAENGFGATVRLVYSVTEDDDTNVIDHLIMQK